MNMILRELDSELPDPSAADLAAARRAFLDPVMDDASGLAICVGGYSWVGEIFTDQRHRCANDAARWPALATTEVLA